MHGLKHVLQTKIILLTSVLFFLHSGSSQGSHTSKYFGSIDSSENDHSRKQPAGGSSSAGGEEQFIKCVLQDPIWLLMANTDDKVMMNYQLPVRYDAGQNVPKLNRLFTV